MANQNEPFSPFAHSPFFSIGILAIEALLLSTACNSNSTACNFDSTASNAKPAAAGVREPYQTWQHNIVTHQIAGHWGPDAWSARRLFDHTAHCIGCGRLPRRWRQQIGNVTADR